MASTPFTRNYRDHSNDSGFQFEFQCDKCGNGHRSTFQTSTVGMAATLLKAAGSLFGGRFSSVGHGADQVKDVLRGPAWDSAFQAAIAEIRPKFHQCTRCGRWICPDVCWNQERGLCEECAPDLLEAAASLQARTAVEQLAEKVRATDQTGGMDAAAKQSASCPQCGAGLTPMAKFCQSCGSAVGEQVKSFCSHCGGAMLPGAKFCPACGTKAGSPKPE